MRKEALEWWRSISVEAQMDYAKSWQNSLSNLGTGPYGFKYWIFGMITNSDSTIERIYKWLNGL